MKQLVKLNRRASSDGSRFTYVLRYTDNSGKRRWETLGHSDKRKAEKQRAQKERELRMGYVEPGSMSLSVFVEDSLARTGDQIRESTRDEYRSTMRDFIKVIGDKDYQAVAIEDAERYRQKCLDRGNKPATVTKKLKEIKCVFETAVRRRQLDENPLRYIMMPKCPKSEIHIYSDAECERIVRTARDFALEHDERRCVRWDLLILVALATGLRRGELLNATWADVDFQEQTLRVFPKADTTETWLWLIKDTDRRTLPLTEELTQRLVDHQNRQPEGHPYVFIAPARYDHIQRELRAKGNWTYSDSGQKVVPLFNRHFVKILARAGLDRGKFHDLRRTAICNWLAEELGEFEVMQLAGHSNFATTHRYYLKARDDLVHRARQATARGLCQKLVQIGAASDIGSNGKKAAVVNPCREMA